MTEYHKLLKLEAQDIQQDILHEFFIFSDEVTELCVFFYLCRKYRLFGEISYELIWELTGVKIENCARCLSILCKLKLIHGSFPYFKGEAVLDDIFGNNKAGFIRKYYSYNWNSGRIRRFFRDKHNWEEIRAHLYN